MKIVILQSNYIPWKGYFDLINDADTFCFYDEVQYTKNDWRNRNKILGPNGLFWLTIPIEKNAVKDKISEATIINDLWQKKHFKTIEQNYSKAINKNSVLDLLAPIYLDNVWSNLSQLNQRLIIEISNFLGITTNFENSATFELKDDKINRLIHLIKQLNGTEYISGPAGMDYLKNVENIFSENEINLTYKKYGPYLKYDNQKSEFEDYVSIIDLIMNAPKDKYLEYFSS